MMRYFMLAWIAAKANLQSEASRAYLGLLWWLLEPLAYMAVFYIVFTKFFNRGGEHYVIFLLSGLVLWKWFVSGITLASSSIVNRYPLMQQVYVPKLLFPIIDILGVTLKFCVVFAVFLIFVLAYGLPVAGQWLWLPFLLLIQLFFMFALGSMLAAVVPFMQDLRIIIENALMLGLFVSGIFFDIRQLHVGWKNLLYLNPMAVIIQSFRDVLISHHQPVSSQLIYVVAFSSVLLSLAWWMLIRLDRIYPRLR